MVSVNTNDKTFTREFAKLNSAQKAAASKTDGVVMVVAGPGTGKTQLLAMRVANILRETDADPSNILCLTFTESAAANMTERLSRIIGADAYRVAVHTFHSFGTEVISRHGEYFFNGAIFRPADEITTFEILENILEKLPHDNPLAKTMNGQWTYLGDLAKSISDFKKAGLAPVEARQILQQNLEFASAILPDFQNIFAATVSRKTIIEAEKLILTAKKVANRQEKFSFYHEPNLAKIFSKSLSRAVDECLANDNKTTSLTKWKRAWSTKNEAGELILTDQKRSEKLLAVADVYEKYMAEMETSEFYDFDDMILNVCRAIEKNPDLKSDLQEQFQYILVDEFQDTNDAQMRLLNDLTDYDEVPNVMAVGDDDQAIYRFQGADISNIQNFAKRFPRNLTVTLTENYRSGKEILSLASSVATQISERLNENEKILVGNITAPAEISRIKAVSVESENAWVADEIAKLLKNDAKPEEIAVIARNHRQLESLLPFLAAKNIAVDYERSRKATDSEPVAQLIQLAILIEAISVANSEVANEYLPKILAHESWKIAPIDVWKISLVAHKNRREWIDEMREFSDKTREIADWLFEMARKSQIEPLENMLDQLFGTPTNSASNDKNTDIENPENSRESRSETFVSPLYNYFFASEKLQEQPESYLNFLNDLMTLRDRLRNFRPDERLTLRDFLEFIRECENLGKPIIANYRLAATNRVKLLTAHKAKGLEFKTVFVISTESQVWGAKARGRTTLLAWPHNMPFSLPGNSDDEKLRLLFVALSRAKQKLVISSHAQADDKPLLPLEYLLNLKSQELPAPDIRKMTREIATAWNPTPSFVKADLRELLDETLANYKLSATHLNNFIDVSRGGPEHFLMQNLLHFPEAKSPQAAFGTAVHEALARAHVFMSANQANKPLEDVLGDFANLLGDADLSERDYNFYLKKGDDALTVFYDQRFKSFATTQRAEYSFASENVMAGGAKLTGKIDLLDVNKTSRSLILTDYKTGKPATSWGGKTDYEKIKLHKYRQQLLFYKLLIENSREFASWRVEKGILEFVEPRKNGEIATLEIDYDAPEITTELAEFRELVAAIWSRILDLDFPDISAFSLDYKGILDFENYLRET